MNSKKSPVLEPGYQIFLISSGDCVLLIVGIIYSFYSSVIVPEEFIESGFSDKFS